MAAGNRGFRHWDYGPNCQRPFIEPGDPWHGTRFRGPSIGGGGPWVTQRFEMMPPSMPNGPPFHPNQHDSWLHEMEVPYWETQMEPNQGFAQAFDHIKGRMDYNFFKKQKKKMRFFSPAQPASAKEDVKKIAHAKTTSNPQSKPVSEAASADLKDTNTQNGHSKKEEAQIKQPNKKPKVEESNAPDKISPTRKDPEMDPSVCFAQCPVYSCKLCRFETADNIEFQKHLNSSQHSEIMKHLYIFLPKDTVNFLQEYILFENRRVSQERKRLNLQSRKDSFKGISQKHFFHRVEVAHCVACDVLIPEVPELLNEHIKTETHVQKCKATAKEIKSKCLTAAKGLLQDKYILSLLKHYSKGKNLSTFTERTTVHVGSHEVLVAEEDDDDDDDDVDNNSVPENEAESGSSYIVDTTEDPISERKSSSENVLHPTLPEIKNSGSSDINISKNLDHGTVNDEEAAEAP